MEKCHFLMIPISKNGPDMASVHKFWYFLLVTYSFSLENSNFWTKLYIRDGFLLGTAHFVKSMPPSLLELKVTPSFCLPFKIPDDPTATIVHGLLELSKSRDF